MKPNTKLKFLARFFSIIFCSLFVPTAAQSMPLKNEAIKKWLSEWTILFEKNIAANLEFDGINGKIDLEKTVCMLKNNNQLDLCSPVVDSEGIIVGFSKIPISVLSKNVKLIELLDWLENRSGKKIEFKNDHVGVNVIIEKRTQDYFFKTKLSDFLFKNEFLNYFNEQDYSQGYTFLSETALKGKIPQKRNWVVQKITKKGVVTLLNSFQI